MELAMVGISVKNVFSFTSQEWHAMTFGGLDHPTLHGVLIYNCNDDVETGYFLPVSPSNQEFLEDFNVAVCVRCKSCGADIDFRAHVPRNTPLHLLRDYITISHEGREMVRHKGDGKGAKTEGKRGKGGKASGKGTGKPDDTESEGDNELFGKGKNKSSSSRVAMPTGEGVDHAHEQTRSRSPHR